MTQGADYSGGRPSGAALQTAGFSVALRYVGMGSAGKRLTAAEYRNLASAGITVLTVAELGTSDSWGTSSDDDYARGKANAAQALADCRAIGIPEAQIFIFAASDAHATAQWQITDTINYVKGFRDVLGWGRTGHYGFSETQIAVYGANVASGYWRCGSQPSATDQAWVNFWQRNAAPTIKVVAGVVCDINDQLNPLGQVAPSPVPVPTGSVEIMDPILVKASMDTTTIRIRNLTGTASTALIIRPAIDGTGKAVDSPVWLGNIFAWGDDANGVGANPAQIPGYNSRIESDRRVPLPGALWCDLQYSCVTDFYIQPVG